MNMAFVFLIGVLAFLFGFIVSFIFAKKPRLDGTLHCVKEDKSLDPLFYVQFNNEFILDSFKPNNAKAKKIVHFLVIYDGAYYDDSSRK